MDAGRASAGIIIVGSLLFLAAAFSPISRIFGIRDASEKLEIITASPIQWTVAQVFFALGAVVTVAGIGLLAYQLRDQGFSIYLHSGTALMGIGSLLWIWHVFARAVDPALFVAGGIPLWLFGGYSLLTIVGLALVGVALLQAGLQDWVGWLSIGAAVLFFVLGILFRDMPPFVYYAITLTIGIVLYRAASSAGVATG